MNKNKLTEQDYKNYENAMRTTVSSVFEDILKEHNHQLNISVKARGGAEISEILQEEFLKFLAKPENAAKYPQIYQPIAADVKATKSPYDIAWRFNDGKIDDLIWGDIKTFKTSAADSNPDMGTPNKVLQFIKEGHFYLTFVMFKYEQTPTGLKFSPMGNGKYVDFMFLKDAPEDLRINPKPQFQMNISGTQKYRTRTEFIAWFEQLWNDSLTRIEKKIPEQRKKITENFGEIKKQHKM